MDRKKGRHQFHIDLAYEYRVLYRTKSSAMYTHLEIIDIFIWVPADWAPHRFIGKLGSGKLGFSKLGPNKFGAADKASLHF